MQPTALDVVDAFPTLPNGKIDRASLKLSLLLACRVTPTKPQKRRQSNGLPTHGSSFYAERIGRNDNFFALGTSYWRHTRHRIRQHYQLEIPIKTIFQQPELRRQQPCSTCK